MAIVYRKLSVQLGGTDPHGDVTATIRLLLKDWQRDRKLPTDLVQRVSHATVAGQQCWESARANDDFGQLRDSLHEIVELKREVGARLADGTELTTYEALMDEYEPDASEEDIQQVFDAVRTPLVELIGKIQDAPKRPGIEILKRDYAVDSQRQLCAELARRIGFDFQRGRLDETAHPFCTTLGPDDCRILTRLRSPVVTLRVVRNTSRNRTRIVRTRIAEGMVWIATG